MSDPTRLPLVRPALVAGVLSALLVLTAAMTGCGGPKNFLNDNDTLRRENLELTQQIEQLEARLQHRLGQIESLKAQLHNGDLPPDVDPPIVAGLSIDSYSGPVDTDLDGTDDVVRLYVLPTDQQGRMLPVAGSLTTALLLIPDQGEPRVWRELALDPAALDDAYRDGFTGPYYKVELPLTDWPGGDVTVRCVLQSAGAAVQRAQAVYAVRQTPGGESARADDGL